MHILAIVHSHKNNLNFKDIGTVVRSFNSTVGTIMIRGCGLETKTISHHKI